MQRGNVRISNLELLNVILYVTEHGCKWRGLPRRFGNVAASGTGATKSRKVKNVKRVGDRTLQILVFYARTSFSSHWKGA